MAAPEGRLAENIVYFARALRAAGMPVISWTIRSKAQADTARRYSDQITFEGFRP